MKSNAFGLDIGSTTIKAVWLNRDKDVVSYESAVSIPTPTPGIQSESPFDHQEMAQHISKFVKDAKIGVSNVNIALPENHVFTKVIDMPLLSEKELATAIYWEAEQYVPAPLDTMALDHTIISKPSETTTEAQMQVLLVAAPHKIIDKYKMVLELAGLSVVSVEPMMLSVIRGLVKGENFPTSIILNIGSLNTSLSIVQKGVIIFSYHIPLGGIALTRAIASDFGITIEKAEEYKRTYGMSDKNFGAKVSNAIAPIFTSILTEVKKAIAFYNDKYKNDSPISQILLTGAGSKLLGIDLHFVRAIGIEAVIANPWKMLDIKNTPESVLSTGPEYTAAVGLALKEYE